MLTEVLSKNCVNTKVPASSIVGPAKNRIIPKIALIEARVNWALTVLKLLFSMDINEEKNSILPIFFFLVQAQNIKQLRPWFHPKWPYCIEKNTRYRYHHYTNILSGSLSKQFAKDKCPESWSMNMQYSKEIEKPIHRATSYLSGVWKRLGI